MTDKYPIADSDTVNLVLRPVPAATPAPQSHRSTDNARRQAQRAPRRRRASRQPRGRHHITLTLDIATSTLLAATPPSGEHGHAHRQRDREDPRPRRRFLVPSVIVVL
ncbi:hypothetical protein B0H17DRAFT_1327691, partial [Mycena rosella]